MSELGKLFIPSESLKVIFDVFTRRYQPDQAWHSHRFFIKFIARSLWYPITTYQYLKRLASFPEFTNFVERQGLLCAKIHRPYLYAKFNVKQRAEAIITHYQWVSQLTHHRLKQTLLSRTPVVLATWHGKENQQLSIDCGPAQFDREGEVTLRLYYEHQPIAIISFSFCYFNQVPVLFVGGLQGVNTPDNYQLIRQATKACYGIFPKRILVEVAGQLAIASGVRRIRAVSDKTHIFSRTRYRFSKQKNMHASYDEFWQSLGGTEESCLFQVNIPLERKELASVASKKRAEYRRRYELFDQIHQLVASGLNEPTLQSAVVKTTAHNIPSEIKTQF